MASQFKEVGDEGWNGPVRSGLVSGGTRVGVSSAYSPMWHKGPHYQFSYVIGLVRPVIYWVHPQAQN